MPLNPVAVSAALTPTVISTWFSHLFPRKSHENKPTTNLSYDEGIHLIRDFLAYCAKHPVEDLQAFTSQRVPSPHWVRTETVTIPSEHLSFAATAIIDQLGPKGVSRIGGKEWWQWRGPSGDLQGEWVEMKRDYNERKRANAKCKRNILYIHGGAFCFGSIESYRYQLQRHARKLKGRVFAPEYRLSPQFPFPCPLQDCLAAYHFLLTTHDPNEIIFAGDSAGGGLVFSMLVTIRDRGLPLPAGAVLISPWVDLNHSFPSILSHNPGDYLPPNGFMHKPSQAWPPPSADEIAAIRKEKGEQMKAGHDENTAEEHLKAAILQDGTERQKNAVQGYSVSQNGSSPAKPAYPGERVASDAADEAKMESITVVLDGETVEIKDQIQMYTTNQLLDHPLVSPVLQPSLGGLPPLFVLVGGGEMLRDEQFYIAHKAANPTAYAPSDTSLNEHDPDRELLNKYPPTYVQLQIWDNLCHSAPTLSFTRPAKHMFRAIAQFGAWALATAQNTELDILDDGDVSPIPSDADSQQPSGENHKPKTNTEPASVGRAGDPLPAFYKHMIRQRVSESGHVYPMDPPSTSPVLQIPSSQVGAINPQLVKKWIAEKREWDEKFAKEKLRMRQQQMKELARGLQDFNGESPPPSSLAARRAAPGVRPPHHGKKNYPLFLWSRLASKHDERVLGREIKARGAYRSRSVDGARTRAIDQPAADGHLHLMEQRSEAQVLSGTGSEKHTIEAGQVNRSTTAEDTTGLPLKLSIDKPMSPLLILPDDEVKHSTDENASTRALFHAPGTLPMSSQVSVSASNRPTSWTVRSRSDDVSTIGDRESFTVTGTGLDDASTRAVVGAKGVVGLVDRPDTASTPGTPATPRGLGDAKSASHSGAVETAEQAETSTARADKRDAEEKTAVGPREQ